MKKQKKPLQKVLRQLGKRRRNRPDAHLEYDDATGRWHVAFMNTTPGWD